ncbi:MAG: IS66 family insertion sequence element accessory protein TnpB [Treponema sp.]|nr:IS66 family insertion sequence element accessory protein TnpB [Treponema sp.]
MAQTRQTIICEWCGEEFSALISTNRKYCSFECSVAGRHQPDGPQKARHRIYYHNPEEWRELLQEAERKAEKTYKRGRRVWLVCGVTSMYNGLDGLVGIIQYQLNRNPFDGDIYVFCDVSGTMLKYLDWDGAGFCVAQRRAQSGSYPWPPAEAGSVIEITEKEFEFLKTKSIVPIGQKAKSEKRKKNKKKLQKTSCEKIGENADIA